VSKLPRASRPPTVMGTVSLRVDELAESLADYGRNRSLEAGERSWEGAKDLLRLLPRVCRRIAGPSKRRALHRDHRPPIPIRLRKRRLRRAAGSPGTRNSPSRLRGSPLGFPTGSWSVTWTATGQLDLGEFSTEGGRAAWSSSNGTI